MKKSICMLLTLILAFSMFIPAFARYEGCPDCETALKTKTETRYEAEKCPVVEGKWDLWTYKYRVEYCPDCGTIQSEVLLSQTYKCGHKAS